MLKKIRGKMKKVNSQKGFTLLEILVVLTIMGFLIAMVAPRLASIGDSASETVCNSSKNRYRTYISTFYNQSDGKYPDMLTNLVVTDGTAAAMTYQIAPASWETDDDVKAVLAKGHNMMYKYVVHNLNAAEAAELNDLGIARVLNLNDYTGLTGNGSGGYLLADARETAPHSSGTLSNWADIAAISDPNAYMDIVDIAAGVGVAMCGCGAPSSADPAAFETCPNERSWAEEDLLGRIVLSIGPESELVTSGIISNAANCPGSIIRSDYFTFGGYYLILPRLAATQARFEDAGATFPGIWTGPVPTFTKLKNMTAVAWQKGVKPTTNYDIAGNTEGYKIRIMNLTKAQETWEFRTNRDRNDEVWGLDLNKSTTLNGG
jgi:prepilin-type N-terminal cleavage/methylation domain-containing protein